jgi:hypothetical protein
MRYVRPARIEQYEVWHDATVTRTRPRCSYSLALRKAASRRSLTLPSTLLRPRHVVRSPRDPFQSWPRLLHGHALRIRARPRPLTQPRDGAHGPSPPQSLLSGAAFPAAPVLARNWRDSLFVSLGGLRCSLAARRLFYVDEYLRTQLSADRRARERAARSDGPPHNDPGLRHRGRNYLAVICFFCEALMKQVLFAAPGSSAAFIDGVATAR